MKKLLALILSIGLIFSSAALAETWTGEALGFGGPVTVELTTENGVIVSVKVKGDLETASIGGVAFTVLEEQILESQNADIDGVAGATVTSTAVKEAAAAAHNAFCGVKAESVSFIPGTYEGTGEGMFAPVAVSVTVSEDAIVDVKVVQHADTAVIAEAAIAEVPARIIEKQSLAIDVASGATVTSKGIINAVKNALTPASNDLSALTVMLPDVEKTVLPDENYDIVIVGAGGAGLSAAVEAGRIGDYSVLVLEKESWIGGSTALSGGGIFVAGTEQNKGVDIGWVITADGQTVDCTPEEAVAYYSKKANAVTLNENGYTINTELVRKVFEKSASYYAYLLSQGMETGLNVVVPSYIDVENHRGIMGLVPSDGRIGATRIWSKWLSELAQKNNAEIRTNAKVTSLLGDGKVVTGVTIETPDSIYNVNARKVIIATGSFPQNRELVLEHCSMFNNIEHTWAFCAPGLTGDALAMLEPFDAQLTGYGMVMQFGIDEPWAFETGYGDICQSFYLNVDKTGARYTNETDWYYDKADVMLKMDTDKWYNIVPASVAAAQQALFDRAVAEGVAVLGENADDLARKSGMDPAKLQQSIVEYQERQKTSGVDTYGFPTPDICAEEPMYAVNLELVILDTMTGPKLDNDFRVLNTNGEVIENVFAAGSVALGNFMLEKYYSTTNAVGLAIYGGALAADSAVAELDANK